MLVVLPPPFFVSCAFLKYFGAADPGILVVVRFPKFKIDVREVAQSELLPGIRKSINFDTPVCCRLFRCRRSSKQIVSTVHIFLLQRS